MKRFVGCQFRLFYGPFYLTYLQPPGNAHPGCLGQQNFVFQFAAFKKDALATEWGDGLHMVAVVNAQFTTILGQPIFIEV